MPGVTGKEVLQALLRGGFEVSHTRGSHYYLRKAGVSGCVIVPVHGGHDMPPGTLGLKLRQAGLSQDEFLALLKS